MCWLLPAQSGAKRVHEKLESPMAADEKAYVGVSGDIFEWIG